jgi:hypothetical protein
MTNPILPKSLHTVTVLANVAEDLIATGRFKAPRAAVKAVLGMLGYADTPDTYGLADKAVAVLEKRVGGAK